MLRIPLEATNNDQKLVLNIMKRTSAVLAGECALALFTKNKFITYDLWLPRNTDTRWVCDSIRDIVKDPSLVQMYMESNMEVYGLLYKNSINHVIYFIFLDFNPLKAFHLTILDHFNISVYKIAMMYRDVNYDENPKFDIYVDRNILGNINNKSCWVSGKLSKELEKKCMRLIKSGYNIIYKPN